MHVAQLRREFDDVLFARTASGLAFTPGGLRLASRAVEILGLQDRTVREVSQAGDGRRVLRVATSHLFAEHAAPGLIDLFAGRAADLEVELSVQPVSHASPCCSRPAPSTWRSVPPRPRRSTGWCSCSSWCTTCSPWSARTIRWPIACRTRRPGASPDLVPGAVGRRRRRGGARDCSAGSRVPEQQQRIFQSEAAALEETKRSDGIAPGGALRGRGRPGSRTAGDPRRPGPEGHRPVVGDGAAHARPDRRRPPSCCASSPLRGPPRRWCAAPACNLGRFKPAVHVTLWS